MPPSDARFTTIAATSSAANALEVTGGATAEQLALDKGLALSGGTLTDAGIVMPSDVPADTSFALYNNAGTLTWNGIPLATGSSLSGTTGKLAKFTASNAVGDSIVSESGAVVTVTGTLNATSALQLNGTSINTGGTLSNVAYLDQANTFSNASGQTFAGGISLSGGVPSTHGIVIPNAVPGSTTTNLYNNAGALTWSGSVAWGGGSAISSSSNVALLNAANTFTVSSAFPLTLQPGTGTSYAAMAMTNTGGSAYVGQNGSTAGSFFSDGTAYATFIRAASGTPIEFGIGTTKYMSISAAGLLAVNGAGTNTFDATTTGTQAVRVRNLSNGSAARSSFYVGNDGSATRFTLDVFSSTFSAGAPQYADGVALIASGSGGLNINASNASGDVRIYSRGALAATFGASQGLTLNSYLAIPAGQQIYLDGGSNTYITESSADTVRGYAGGTFAWQFDSSIWYFQTDASVPATKKFYLDGGPAAGGGDTYWTESSANEMRSYCGGSLMLQINNTGLAPGAYPTTASAANLWGAAGDYIRISTSSLRYKHDIATLDTADAQAALMAMRPVTYRGKTDDDQRRYVGFIAEEMQQIAPLLCTYDEGGESGTPNYVTYDRVTAYLVAVVQKQQAEIDALKAQMKEQK